MRCGARESARPGGRRTGSGTVTPPRCCWPELPSGWSPGGSATPTCRPRWTSTAGCVRTRRCALRRTGRGTCRGGRSAMADERRLRAVDDVDPIWRLWEQLPPQWRGPVIGEGIDNWRAISENGQRRLKLTGLPDTIAAELAWMAYWQAQDG